MAAAPATSVRGGYGMYYDVLGPNRISVNQMGYSRDTALTPSLDNGQTFIATLSQSVSGRAARTGRHRARPDDQRRACGVAFPYVGEVRTHSIIAGRSGVQQELPWRLLVEATYVGALVRTCR